MFKQLNVWTSIFITFMNVFQESMPVLSFTHGNIFAGEGRIDNRVKRIAGGIPLSVDKFKSLVFLSNNATTERCAGFIYNKSCIVTAARCFNSVTPDQLIVTAGERYLNKDEGFEQRRNVSSIIKHPHFNDFLDNNIALLVLREPLDLNADRVEPAEINTNNLCPVKPYNCYITGWGDVTENMTSPLQLTFTMIPVINNQDCNLITDTLYNNNVFDFHICAGNLDKGRGACKGDYGAPLYCTCDKIQRVAGIVSEMKECGSKKNPAKFTRVSCFSEWIKTGSAKSSCEGRKSVIAQSEVENSSNTLSLGYSVALLCVLYWGSNFTGHPK